MVLIQQLDEAYTTMSLEDHLQQMKNFELVKCCYDIMVVMVMV